MQKYSKGYATWKKVRTEMKEIEMQKFNDYILLKRFEILTDSQIKIAYLWKQFKKR